jgi:DNA-directed RNA polymerase subunit F
MTITDIHRNALAHFLADYHAARGALSEANRRRDRSAQSEALRTLSYARQMVRTAAAKLHAALRDAGATAT